VEKTTDLLQVTEVSKLVRRHHVSSFVTFVCDRHFGCAFQYISVNSCTEKTLETKTIWEANSKTFKPNQSRLRMALGEKRKWKLLK
jgi:hypothetical protein